MKKRNSGVVNFILEKKNKNLNSLIIASLIKKTRVFLKFSLLKFMNRKKNWKLNTILRL